MQVTALSLPLTFKNRNSATAGLCWLLRHIRTEIFETVVDVPGVCKVSRTLREFLASIYELIERETHSLVKSSTTNKDAP